MTSTVPLNRLHISDLNVRKTDRDLDIDQLADDIDAKGLLQNLVVVPEGPSAHFGVVAGGRRLLALQLLVERGRKAADWPVPVVRERQEDGRAVSLSENLQRVDMNPADEVAAFAAIVADYEARGETDRLARVERCARHFGETVRHIEQRLRLAALAPEILDGLRVGKISLDSARAYAAYPDQDLQMRVFAQMDGIAYALAGAGEGQRNRHSVAAIRAALAGKVYRQSARQVHYVGVDAYLAAGGRIERELFMGAEDEDVLLDTALVDRLCTAKAEAEAATIAADAGFGSALVSPWPNVQDFPRTPRGYVAAFGAAEKTVFAGQADDAILVCRIAPDGSRLEKTQHCFVRERRPQGAGIAPAPRRAAAPESEIERLGRIRRQRIETRAVAIAAPRIAGTALDGRAWWPDYGARAIPPIAQEEETGDFVVAMLVRIPAADVDRVRAAAERAIDLEESKDNAAKEGLAASVDIAPPEWPLHPAPAAPHADVDADARVPEPAQ